MSIKLDILSLPVLFALARVSGSSVVVVAAGLGGCQWPTSDGTDAGGMATHHGPGSAASAGSRVITTR